MMLARVSKVGVATMNPIIRTGANMIDTKIQNERPSDLKQYPRIQCPNNCDHHLLERTDSISIIGSEEMTEAEYFCQGCTWNSIWTLGIPGLKILFLGPYKDEGIDWSFWVDDELD